MKLIDVVNANMAVTKMSGLMWPYDLALALVKVRRSTADETVFFAERELELLNEFAAFDDNGDVRLSPSGRCLFKDPTRGDEYERARALLCDTDAGGTFSVLRVKAPAEIQPDWLAALDGFIEFVT